MPLILKTITVGPFASNCVIVGCKDTKEAVIIDTGDESERILDIVNSNKSGLKVKHIILTHGHLDHIAGIKEVKESLTSSQIYLHKGDKWLYDNLVEQANKFGLEAEPPPKVDKFIEDGDTINFGKYILSVMHTPGHSPGSICLKMSDNKRDLVFSGDTLFAQGIGRYDLWCGSFEEIIHSIKTRLLTLSDDTLVYPGHGPDTTIGIERNENPFLV